MERGLVQVYTGEGKGKTTAALGLALRACGHGFKVFLAQFAKGKDYGELAALERLADRVQVRQYGRARFIHGEPSPEDIALARQGWREVLEVAARGDFDLLILDEIGIALFYRMIGLEDVRRFVQGKPENLELVLTGRRIPEELFELAALVTEMREIKHYFARGIQARKGIEY
jgi:cob(I)alamin adenosyltransferase